jgi:hypothetical protein
MTSLVTTVVSAPLIGTKFLPSVIIGFSAETHCHRFFHYTSTNYRKMVSKLDDTQRVSMLNPIINNGWAMDKNGRDAIKKKFVFGDFNEAFGFMTRVAIKGKLKTNGSGNLFNLR